MWKPVCVWGPGRTRWRFVAVWKPVCVLGAGKNALCFGVEETCVRFGGLEERSGGGCAFGGPGRKQCRRCFAVWKPVCILGAWKNAVGCDSGLLPVPQSEFVHRACVRGAEECREIPSTQEALACFLQEKVQVSNKKRKLFPRPPRSTRFCSLYSTAMTFTYNLDLFRGAC